MHFMKRSLYLSNGTGLMEFHVGLTNADTEKPLSSGRKKHAVMVK